MKQFAIEVTGNYALFTSPETKANGEKFTLDIPTYSALEGLIESIYWKPTIKYVIDKVRIMNEIHTQSIGMTPIKWDKTERDLNLYTYLCDVKYQILFHYEWSNDERYIQDRNENKHDAILLRAIEHGGRRHPVLGVTECPAEITLCNFGDGVGFYDNVNRNFNLMFHSFSYPNENAKHKLYKNLDYIHMVNGVITFNTPNKTAVQFECEG